MPRVARSRFRCAYALEAPKPKRAPAKKRSEMTEDEKLEVDTKRMIRKAFKERKEEWDKSLPAPWNGPGNFSWPTDTLVCVSSSPSVSGSV